MSAWHHKVPRIDILQKIMVQEDKMEE